MYKGSCARRAPTKPLAVDTVPVKYGGATLTQHSTQRGAAPRVRVGRANLAYTMLSHYLPIT